MHILKVGLNYRTAPVEVREQLVFQEDNVDSAMIYLNLQKSILENVIISTCNRTEIYVVADQLHTGRYYIKQFLEDWFKVDKEVFLPYLEIIEDDAAVEQLFRVTSGLDSMILGETQILGQVRQAFFTAQHAKTTGTLFNELFKQAITFAKKAHKDTAIGEHAVSVSYAAIQLAAKEAGSFVDKKIAVLGTGKMGALALKHIQALNGTQITVLNRTYEKAAKLAEIANCEVEPIEQLSEVLKDTDILISSTGAENIVITKEFIDTVLVDRAENRKLFMIDIAVPRDIDPLSSEHPLVSLFDVDSLQNIVDDNLGKRKEAAKEIELMLEKEIVEFNEWLNMLGVVPIISALRDKALSIQHDTMESIERKMPDLTNREKKVLNKHTKSIINQLLKEPIKQAKELASIDDSTKALSLFIDIFGLDEAIKQDLYEKSQNNQQKVALQKHVEALSIELESKISSQ